MLEESRKRGLGRGWFCESSVEEESECKRRKGEVRDDEAGEKGYLEIAIDMDMERKTVAERSKC